jgi:hypothetical protein
MSEGGKILFVIAVIVVVAGIAGSLSESKNADTAGVPEISKKVDDSKDACLPIGGIPADPSWQNCSDSSHATYMQALKLADADPVHASHKGIVDLTMKDAEELYRLAKAQYLRGYTNRNIALSSAASLQEIFLEVPILNAIGLLNKSNPDFTDNLAEYDPQFRDAALRNNRETAGRLAAAFQRPDASLRCESSLDTLRRDLDRGSEQLSLAEHLNAESDPEEYYLRVNYGDMLISTVGSKLVCFELHDEPTQAATSGAPNESVKLEDSKPPAVAAESPDDTITKGVAGSTMLSQSQQQNSEAAPNATTTSGGVSDSAPDVASDSRETQSHPSNEKGSRSAWSIRTSDSERYRDRNGY